MIQENRAKRNPSEETRPDRNPNETWAVGTCTPLWSLIKISFGAPPPLRIIEMTNVRRNRLCLAAFRAFARAVACRVHSKHTPAVAPRLQPQLSRTVPPHCSRSRVRNSMFWHPSTAAQRLGMFSHSISARYFCSLQQEESSSSERAEVAYALAGAAARSALVRALSARIM